MLSNEVDKQRCIQFYHWARRDLEHEIAEDFPLLRTVPSLDAKCYLELLQVLPLPQRKVISTALLRWSHQAALILLGETRTAEEKTVFEDYKWECVLIRSRIQQQMRTRFAASTPLKADGMRKLVRHTLEDMLGVRPRPDWPDLLFIVPVGEWFIGTCVQLSERGSRLRYCQSVMMNETDYSGLLPCPSQNGTNIVSWLGVGRTDWDIPYEFGESAVEAFAHICNHYLKNIGGVLEGLHPEAETSWNGVHWWQSQQIEGKLLHWQ